MKVPTVYQALSRKTLFAAAILVICSVGFAQQKTAVPAVTPDTTATKTPQKSAVPTVTPDTSATKTPQKTAGPAVTPDIAAAKTLSVVAKVNNEPISREKLGQECLLYFGHDIAERMVNKYLIQSECAKQKIVITREDVRTEIERMAKNFNLPVTQWLNLLRDERGINEQQYSEDIIWPSLALKAIAKNQITVSQADIQKAYDRICGPNVQARIIVLGDKAKAEEIQKTVFDDPSRFSAMVKQYSIDSATASNGGVTPAPLRMHSGNDDFDKLVFGLKPGEVSPVYQIGNQYIILICDKINPGTEDKNPMDQMAPKLEEELKVQKLAKVSEEIFKKLQAAAHVTIVLGNPELEQKYPTAAILINDKQISRNQVAEKCIERHGKQVLNGLIQYTIVEQAAKNAGITVSEADIDNKVAEIAADVLPPKADGTPDVEKWYQTVANEQNVTKAQYRKQLWPMIALSKMVQDNVRVESDDIQKGYEANFGPRVKVRAIILSDMRTAQRVWAEARKNPTESNFGDLCMQYSIDPNTRAIRGEVPPIQRHGGMPELESEAFKLKKGELSDIVTVGQNFVIMLCLGQTEPTNVPLAQVKDEIIKDVTKKKLEVLISEKVEQLCAQATTENLLTGDVQSPKNAQAEPSAERKVESRAGSRNE